MMCVFMKFVMQKKMEEKELFFPIVSYPKPIINSNTVVER